MCCLCFCIPGDPVEDNTGRIKVFLEGEEFKASMMKAPFSSCSSFMYCAFQFIPCTMGCAQYMLRKKVLGNDMTKYVCGQGIHKLIINLFNILKR